MEDIKKIVSDEYLAIIEIRAQQTEMLKTLQKIVEDHETRLRRVERFVSGALAIIALISLAYDMLKK